MYDAAANTLSWVATLLGLASLARILFSWDRGYPLAIAALVVSAITWVAVRGIESKLTSSNMAIKGKSRALVGLGLAIATILLIVTHNPQLNPKERVAASPAPASGASADT